MKGLWQLWEDLLPAEVCDEIVEEGKKLSFVEARLGRELLVDKNIRSSRISWIDHSNEDFTDVWKFIERKFHEANANAFGVDITYLRSLQFTNYTSDVDGHYDWHEDIFWERDDIYNRKLSMVIQLTKPEEYIGGNLELSVPIPPEQESLRKQGSIIVFPSFVKHRVTRVESGERNSLVTWMEGPLWR